MASEMVDRVARAIHASRQANKPETSQKTTWDQAGQRWKSEAISDAIAAIEAMREPSDYMVIHGVIEISSGCDINKEEAGYAWRAMIDAALGEG